MIDLFLFAIMINEGQLSCEFITFYKMLIYEKAFDSCI